MSMFLCNTCNAPEVLYRDRREIGGKPSEWMWGRVLSWKIPKFYSVGGARSKTAFFRVLGTRRLSCAQPTGNSFTQNQWYRWKAETLKLCLLLVWRVYDQAFGRRVPNVTWLSRKLKICIKTHVEKINWFQNAIVFDLRRKITELSRKTRFRTVASPCLAVLNWRSSSIHITVNV